MTALQTALCFDLDGVLIHSMPLYARAWQEAMKAVCELRVLRQWIYEREGEPGLTTARTLLKSRGVPSWARKSVVLLREKERRFHQLARHVAIDSRLVERLRRFSRQRVPLALVTGDAVRHGKPHPESYRRAFQQLGVKPAQAVVVENAPYGIRAARRAHAEFVIALASSLPTRFLQEAHVVVNSIPQLCTLLDGLSRETQRASALTSARMCRYNTSTL